MCGRIWHASFAVGLIGCGLSEMALLCGAKGRDNSCCQEQTKNQYSSYLALDSCCVRMGVL